MKTHIPIILFCLALPIFCQSDDSPYLVKAEVIGIQKHPEDRLLADMPNAPRDLPPLWSAELKIDFVFRGPASIIGSTMLLTTSHHIPLGNTQSIVPRLQIGDVGIFFIRKYKNGVLSTTYLQPRVEGAAMPLIKGRHSDYDRVVEKLSETSGKPTVDVAPKRNALDDGTFLSAPRQLALPPRQPDEATPTPEPDLNPTSSTPLSFIVVLIVAACGLLWLLLKRRS